MDATAKKKGLASRKEETASAPAEAQAASTEAKRGPIQSFREGDVSVSIWAREYKGRVYHSCSFERSYKDAQGQWRYTRSFGLDDLGKLISLAQKASEYLHGLQDPEARE